jgi:hypothetical protein
MATFIAYPLLALAAAFAFFGAWLWRGARSAAVAGFLWALYGGYEYLMHFRVLCSGECNIRVDLLLIYPLLLAASLAGLWNAARGGKAGLKRPAAPKRP